MKPELERALFKCLIEQIDNLEKDAFESGFKAAGGAIVPGTTYSPTRRIEVALDQDQVDLILAMAKFFHEQKMREIIDLFLGGEDRVKLGTLLAGIIETLSFHGSKSCAKS